MTDFGSMLRRPAGKAVKPPLLPYADYPGVIAAFEFRKTNPSEKNPEPQDYVRLQIKLTAWPDSIPEAQRGFTDSENVFHPMDLTKRQYRKDYYFTEERLYLIDDLIKQCGITADGVRSYEELIPELRGASVTASITQKPSQDGMEFYNEVGSLKGA